MLQMMSLKKGSVSLKIIAGETFICNLFCVRHFLEIRPCNGDLHSEHACGSFRSVHNNNLGGMRDP